MNIHFYDPSTTKKGWKESDTDQGNLNKKELAEALYWTINTHHGENKLTKALSQDIITALFDDSGIIAEFLFIKPANKTSRGKKPNKVTIPGFGTFTTRYRKARKGRHPSQDKQIDIPATYVVSFRAGKGLKEKAKAAVK